MSEIHDNISRNLRTDLQRKFWNDATDDEQQRFVAIVKADGLAEAVKQVKLCADKPEH